MKTDQMIGWLTMLALFVCARVTAAPPKIDDAAQARAASYQAETTAELTRQHWRVTTNKTGRLVATRLLPPDARGNDPLGYMTLLITFQPKSQTATDCGINKVIYLYGNVTGTQFHKTFSGPYPQTDPTVLRDVYDLLARARKRMLAAHPEYAGPGPR